MMLVITGSASKMDCRRSSSVSRLSSNTQAPKHSVHYSAKRATNSAMPLMAASPCAAAAMAVIPGNHCAKACLTTVTQESYGRRCAPMPVLARKTGVYFGTTKRANLLQQKRWRRFGTHCPLHCRAFFPSRRSPKHEHERQSCAVRHCVEWLRPRRHPPALAPPKPCRRAELPPGHGLQLPRAASTRFSKSTRSCNATFSPKRASKERTFFYFHNEDNTRWLDSLAVPVREGDTLTILQAVSGG